MPRRSLKSAAFAVLAGIALSACAGEPYVYAPEEFNRDAPGFGHPLADRDQVEICYNKRSTTPAAIIRMASAECERFGKTARFTGQDYFVCPISTPVRAIYACVRP